MTNKVLPPIVAALLVTASLVVAPDRAWAEDNLVAADQAAPQFFETVTDLPVMEGLSELVDAATMFDTPGGRLVEVYAGGDVAERMIADFYAATLPQLGWAPSPAAGGRMRFERDGESLIMEFAAEQTDADGAWSVRFSIAPL